MPEATQATSVPERRSNSRRSRQWLASRIPVLLRQTQFRRYWSAQTISMFGDQISGIAIPLAAVLVLHATAADMGYLTALVWLPSLLFGLHAGAWVDRRGQRRRTMIGADLGRFTLLASLPRVLRAGRSHAGPVVRRGIRNGRAERLVQRG